MAGGREQGLKAARTNKMRYGDDFYANIGRVGGKKSRGGGFAASHERAVEAGRKGGQSRADKLNKRSLLKIFSFWK